MTQPGPLAVGHELVNVLFDKLSICQSLGSPCLYLAKKVVELRIDWVISIVVAVTTQGECTSVGHGHGHGPLQRLRPRAHYF